MPFSSQPLFLRLAPTSFQRAFAWLLLAICTLPAAATPPAQPTGLTVVTLGVNSFRLTWNDNSTDESFFGVQARVPPSLDWISLDEVPAASGGQVSHTLIIGVEPTNTVLQFQILAVKDGAPQEISGSEVFTAAATPSTIIFVSPSGLTGTATDGTITLNWNDNANSEWGYQVENKEGTNTTWTALGTTGPNQTSSLTISSHRPNTVYQYRVRATKNNNANLTVYSNTFTISTQPLIAPTNLAAIRTNERDIAFTQTDNSSGETGYLIEYRVAGEADWAVLGSVGPNVSSINAITDLFDPATSYEFRTTAFFGEASAPEQFSDPSNIATVQTIFTAPTGLTASPASNTSVQLGWTDNSSVEQGYGVYYRPAGTTNFFLHGFSAADAVSYSVTGLEGGSAYEFQVASAYQANAPTNRTEIVFSDPSAIAFSSTRDEMNGAVYVEAVLGRPFAYTITTTTNSTIASSSVSGLPTGLEYIVTNQTISGTATEAGVFECPVTLEFADGWTQNTTLTVRVLRAPLAGAIIADQALAPAGTTSIPLGGHFSDPDAESAVRVAMNIGNMDFILFDSTTPLTVSNFMAYAEAGDYVDTVFHRSVPGFVVQGGAFRPDPGTGPDAYVSVPTRPQVPNEPGLSSVRATISMAKLGAEAPGGGPDSATNQFFVNLANNGPILNNQNGGFTVFGRVTQPGMVVADQMAALPRGDFNITLNGSPGGFEDWPLTTASQTMDNSLAVKINSVSSIPVLAYSIVTNTHPAVVAAAVNGGALELQALHGGESVITVRATDLDGNSVEQSFTVSVPLSYADWIADQAPPLGQDGAHQDADAGGLDNLAEFAYMGSATNALDDVAVKPVFRLDATNQTLSVEFNLRKGTILQYTVRSASELVPGDWDVVWNSVTNTVSDAQVTLLEDQPTHRRIRVRDNLSPPSPVRRYLSVDVRE